MIIACEARTRTPHPQAGWSRPARVAAPLTATRVLLLSAALLLDLGGAAVWAVLRACGCRLLVSRANWGLQQGHLGPNCALASCHAAAGSPSSTPRAQGIERRDASSAARWRVRRAKLHGKLAASYAARALQVPAWVPWAGVCVARRLAAPAALEAALRGEGASLEAAVGGVWHECRAAAPAASGAARSVRERLGDCAGAARSLCHAPAHLALAACAAVLDVPTPAAAVACAARACQAGAQRLAGAARVCEADARAALAAAHVPEAVRSLRSAALAERGRVVAEVSGAARAAAALRAAAPALRQPVAAPAAAWQRLPSDAMVLGLPCPSLFFVALEAAMEVFVTFPAAALRVAGDVRRAAAAVAAAVAAALERAAIEGEGRAARAVRRALEAPGQRRAARKAARARVDAAAAAGLWHAACAAADAARCRPAAAAGRLRLAVLAAACVAEQGARTRFASAAARAARTAWQRASGAARAAHEAWARARASARGGPTAAQPLAAQPHVGGDCGSAAAPPCCAAARRPSRLCRARSRAQLGASAAPRSPRGARWLPLPPRSSSGARRSAPSARCCARASRRAGAARGGSARG